MKIGVKLVVAFLIVAAIAGSVGIMGLMQIDEVGMGSETLYNKNLLNTANVASAAINYQKMRLYALDMVTNPTEAGRDTSMASIPQFLSEVDEYLDQYAAIDAEDEEAFTALFAQWTEFKGYIEKAMGYARSNQHKEASALVAGDAKRVGMTLQRSFGTLLELNTEKASRQDAVNTRTTQDSKLFMIILLSAGVAIAVALGIILTRSITKPVKVTAAQLTRMANGEDLEAVNAKKFGGEFRQMVSNLNDVRDSLNRLLEDAGMLADAAKEGELSVRADAGRHKGSYRQIVEGFNNTLDAVVSPIKEAAVVLTEVADGNLNVGIESDFAGDYGIIKYALNSTVDALKGYISEMSGVLGELSRGNLDVGITAEYKGDFITLKTSINGIVTSLSEVLGEIGLAADQVASGTRQVSDGSQHISQGAAEQSGSIEELTASATQIAEQTRQNAIRANKANELTTLAAADAARGNGRMKAMQQAMSEISDASRSISKIIKVIDDIAFQTNILALNAAVEAARAGVHGRGFAVVAGEVRNLAARSADAARETTELIEGSIGKTKAGAKIADETAEALKSIVQGVETAAVLVEEIAGASGEQADAITQVNRGIEQMSSVVQANSATAEQAAAAAEELSGQADMLKGMVGRFRLKNETETIPESAEVASLPQVTKIELAGTPKIELSAAPEATAVEAADEEKEKPHKHEKKSASRKAEKKKKAGKEGKPAGDGKPAAKHEKKKADAQVKAANTVEEALPGRGDMATDMTEPFSPADVARVGAPDIDAGTEQSAPDMNDATPDLTDTDFGKY